MYVYGKYSRDSVHAWGPMTNSKYVLGPGTGKQISPYMFIFELSGLGASRFYSQSLAALI
jgi:hypothetical protein